MRGAFWRTRAQNLFPSFDSAERKGENEATRARDMDEQIRLHPVRHWAGDRAWKCLAFPVSLLQKWRRRLFNSVLPDAHSGRHPHVLHGTGPRSDAYHRRTRSLQDRSDIQRWVPQRSARGNEFNFCLQESAMLRLSCLAGWTSTTSSFWPGPFSTSSCRCDPVRSAANATSNACLMRCIFQTYRGAAVTTPGTPKTASIRTSASSFCVGMTIESAKCASWMAST